MATANSTLPLQASKAASACILPTLANAIKVATSCSLFVSLLLLLVRTFPLDSIVLVSLDGLLQKKTFSLSNSRQLLPKLMVAYTADKYEE